MATAGAVCLFRHRPVLPVEGSNLGLRVQSAVSMPTLDQRASVGAPGPGFEPGPAESKSAVLPTTPTGSALARIRTWTGRVLSALPLPLGYKGIHRRAVAGSRTPTGLALDQVPLPVGLQPLVS